MKTLYVKIEKEVEAVDDFSADYTGFKVVTVYKIKKKNLCFVNKITLENSKNTLDYLNRNYPDFLFHFL